LPKVADEGVVIRTEKRKSPGPELRIGARLGFALASYAPYALSATVRL
jgi:hypothetical protein